MLFDFEEIKNKVNATKWYGTDAWYDILNAIADCEDKSRPQGEWINDTRYSGWTCTNCNYHDGNRVDNYCPNCGAKMKG